MHIHVDCTRHARSPSHAQIFDIKISARDRRRRVMGHLVSEHAVPAPQCCILTLKFLFATKTNIVAKYTPNPKIVMGLGSTRDPCGPSKM